MPILRRKSLRILLLCLAVITILTAGFAYRYPGFTSAAIDYSLYTSIHERMNVSFLLLYWLDFLGRLQPDAEHFYTFEGTAAATPFDAALIEYHKGNFADAVGGLERDIAATGETEKKLFWLAMAYLRLGEATNCLPHVMHGAHDSVEHAQYCALPIRKFHTQKEYARAGAKVLLKLLEKYDRKNALYKWLLNYACLITDDFPAGVPEEFRVRPEFVDKFYGEGRRKTEQEFQWLVFEEKAAEFGINTHNAGRGVGVEDFDGDGYLDIITGGNFDDLRYYHNEGGKTFSDWTERGGLGGFRQPFFISVADYDNDGWPDFLVTHMYHDGFNLFRNNGNGTFSDVTAGSGLLDPRPENGLSSAWAPAWADVDNDGDLDLFVAQMGISIPFAKGLLARPKMQSTLYINEGGHFVDRTEAFGLKGIVYDRFHIGAAFGDYDRDGYPDLFLSSPIVNTSVLLHNVGGRRFERSKMLSRVDGGFVGAFLDVNQDGRLDLFHGGFSDARSTIEMALFGANPDEYRSGKSAVLVQGDDGRFTEQQGFFDMPGGNMGASFGDVNNDGCYDFYLGTGSPEGWFVFPKLMFLGLPDGKGGCRMATANVSMTNNLASIQKGHGIVFFDFDDDGLQDIYSSLGGMWPADRWPNQFFVNRSRVSGSWVKIRLRGRKTNRFGLGASIHVTAQGAGGSTIDRYVHMDQKTAFGSGPYVAHIGLGDASSVKTVEVFWPGSGCRQYYSARLDALNLLDEGDCHPQAGSPR
jgi:FG-GAP-like repeat/ASPIC and UnbV